MQAGARSAPSHPDFGRWLLSHPAGAGLGQGAARAAAITVIPSAIVAVRPDEAGAQVLFLYCAGPHQPTYLGSLVIADRSSDDVRRLVGAEQRSQARSLPEGPACPVRRFKLFGRLASGERQGDRQVIAGAPAGAARESYLPMTGRICEVPRATVERLRAEGALVGSLLPGPFASGIRLLPEAPHLQRLSRHLEADRELIARAG